MYAHPGRRYFLDLARKLGAGAAALALLPAPRLARAEPGAIGSIARVKGTASLLRAGAQVILKGGEAIMTGDVLTTLAESRLRVMFADGSQLNFGELTRTLIAEFTFSPGTLTREAIFDLKSGLLQAITAKAGAGSNFTIRTQNAVAATRSTEWIVEAGPAETTVVVQEGKVDVAASAMGFRGLSSAEQDKAMLVSAGQFTTIGKISLGATPGAQPADAARLEKLTAGLAWK